MRPLMKPLIPFIALLIAVGAVAAAFLLFSPQDRLHAVYAERGAVRHPKAKDHIWYVDPATRTRAFIDSADDAITVVRRFGLGISNSDLQKIPEDTAIVRGDERLRTRLAGRIVLQVESKGEPWYIEPIERRRYFLGSPAQIFETLKLLTKDIDPELLKTIPVSVHSPSWLEPPAGYAAEVAASGFSRPRVLAQDPAGRLVVSDFTEKSRVIVLRDLDGDRKFENHRVLVRNLLNGHGVAFAAGRMYVAKEHWLEYWPYDAERVKVAGNSTRIMQLPPGGERFPGQGHMTRTVVVGKDGKLYLSIGSACDHCFDLDENIYSAILRMDLDGRNAETIARGLRNTVFFVQNPETGEWWGNDMGQDNLGDELPPDELNRLVPASHYGWPRCYGDRVSTPENQTPEFCAGTTPPLFTYPAHSAPLGLRFIPASWHEEWGGDLLSSHHGSTVRQGELVGYKIVRIDMDADGNPLRADDAVTGFLRAGSVVVGRPVDLLFAADGSLYVTDDFANVVHRVRPLPKTP